MDFEKFINASERIREIAYENANSPDEVMNILLSSILLFLGNMSVNEEVYEHNLEQAIQEMKEFPMANLLKSRNKNI